MRNPQHGHDVNIRLWPELSDGIAAWREQNGDLGAPDMIRHTYGLAATCRLSRNRRPAGCNLTVHLEDDVFARCRDAAALEAMSVREYVLRRLCDLVGVAVVAPAKSKFGGHVRKPRLPKTEADAALPGDPLSRWPSDVDPVLAIGAADARRRWWKDGGDPPFQVPGNAGMTRHAQKAKARAERMKAERAA